MERQLSISRQLPLSPMGIFARRVKHALSVTVQRSHDTDAREQRWPVKFCDQQQGFHRGLPLVGIVFRFRQFRNVLGGIAQRAQRLLSARQYDWIKKRMVP
jgi:hypothetical protein